MSHTTTDRARRRRRLRGFARDVAVNIVGSLLIIVITALAAALLAL